MIPLLGRPDAPWLPFVLAICACSSSGARPDATDAGGDGASVRIDGGVSAQPDDAGADAGPGRASCVGLPPTCGPAGTADCCASPPVAGGTCNRSNDARFPATVSDFRLDAFEISVGRYRKFTAAYPGNKPKAGAGKNPNDPSDKGWDPAWDGRLPATQQLAVANVKCMAPIMFSDVPGPNDGKPVNCLDWYTAQAFCIWDGGRLPTEAEWNYAAAGGSEQRAYPWSNPPSSDVVDATFAVFAPPATAPAAGGSKSPKGDGKYGHADLAGNVWEWTVDNYTVVSGAPYGSTYSVNPCKDCADRGAGTSRVIRGGAYDANGPTLGTIVRNDQKPDGRAPQIGARCARSP